MSESHATTGIASPDRGRTAPERFLDPRILARIGNLALVARAVVDGFISGLHKAVYRGISPDFAEYRAYSPGDDVRRVDWRVYARTDRLYVKTFEAETNADVVLALDVSGSMDYASGEVTKLDYARFLLASLAHLAKRQRDRVGFAAFDAALREHLPPSARHPRAVIEALARCRAEGAGDLDAALTRLAHRLGRRGIVVVVSDFYLDAATAAAALARIRLAGHDVIAFHVLDPLERDLDIDAPQVLADLETGERIPVAPSGRADYRRLVDAHVAELAAACLEQDVDYTCVTTAEPLDEALWRYLSQRAERERVR